MRLRYLEASEYQAVPLDTLNDSERAKVILVAAETGDPWQEEEPKWATLSMHLAKLGQGNGLSPHAHCLVGQVWLKDVADKEADPIVLRVVPKVGGADALRMFAVCVSNSTVRSHLKETIKIFWHDPPIPVGDRNQDITPLIIGRFLTLLYDLCQKHLLGSVQPIEDNLIGRIRGRPLAQETMRRNLSKGRADRVYCRYQVQSIDTKANQILLAALRQGLKYLDQHDLRKSGLARLAAFSADALNGVTLRRIMSSDFHGLHYGGFMRPYRQPLRWAQLLLRRLGFDPHEKVESLKSEGSLPPFAIDMNELFERYCEVALRKVAAQKVWAGYNCNNIGTAFEVRPDFLVVDSESRWIVDAKYKPAWSWVRHRDDVYQVVTYSRHRGVIAKLDDLGGRPEEPATLVILYPDWACQNSSTMTNGINLRETLSARMDHHEDILKAFQVDLMRSAVQVPQRR